MVHPTHERERLMTTATKRKPQEHPLSARIEVTSSAHADLRRDWRDWLLPGTPMPDQITRDQLLEELQGEGIDIGERRLMYWVTQGVLPRPWRRWHEGAPRAFYPTWMIDVISELHTFQDAGLSLEKIKPKVQRTIFSKSSIPDPYARPQETARAAIAEYVRTHERFTGKRVSAVEVQMLDENGNILDSFDFPVIHSTDD